MKLFGYEIRSPFARQVTTDQIPYELRDSETDNLIRTLTGQEPKDLEPMSLKAAMAIPAVWTALDRLSCIMASLPLDLFKKSDSGAEIQEDEPLHELLKNEPNPWTTGYNFRRAMFVQAMVGDCFVKIHSNQRGEVKKLTFLDNVTVTKDEEGRPSYKAKDRIYLHDEVIHLKAMTLDGSTGIDVLDTHRETLSFAAKAIQYGNAFFRNGAQITGIIKSPVPLNSTEREKIRLKWNSKFQGVKKVGSTAVLDAGMDYMKIGATPDEAGLNESRAFQVREVSRIFGIPLYVFNDLSDSTYTKIESLTTHLITMVVRPWCIQAEQEFRLKLLNRRQKKEGMFFRFNIDGIMRGDYEARAKMYNVLFNTGAISSNEIRERENMNKRENGDEYFVQLNMDNKSNHEDGKGKGKAE